MKIVRIGLICFCVLALSQMLCFGSEGGKPWQLRIGVFANYDDNYNYSEDDPKDTFGIRIEPDIFMNMSWPRTIFTIGYKPAYIVWNDREDDNDDFDHDLYMNFVHGISTRTQFALNNYLRRSEQPELIEDGQLVRPNGDYWWDSLRAVVSVASSAGLGAELTALYRFLRFDEHATWPYARQLDADTYGGGATIWWKAGSKTSIGAQAMYEDQVYDTTDLGDRGSQGLLLALRLRHALSRYLSVNAEGGYQRRDFNEAVTDATERPYGSVGLHIRPSPRTRFQLKGAYRMDTTDAWPYANQTHVVVSGSMDYGLTEKLNCSASLRYDRGDFEADEAIEGTGAMDDGTEEQLMGSVGVSYDMNRNHQLDARWNVRDFNTNVPSTRSDYMRNYVQVGWRMLF